jgi:DNA repair exonuclease SbcCD ATPase subunit
MTKTSYILIATVLLNSEAQSFAQTARIEKVQQPRALLDEKLRQLVADDKDLANEIEAIDKRVQQNTADEKEFLSQVKRLEAALGVVKLQLAAVTARQLSYEDAKNLLEAKNRANAASRQAIEIDRIVLEIAQKNTPEHLKEAKTKQAAAQAELKKISATLPPLETKAAKSRADADAALIRAARDAAALLDKDSIPEPQKPKKSK